MNKLTKKLIKYYIYIITSTIILCFIGSSLFLSNFYLNQQYNELKSLTEDIHDSLEKKENIYINSNTKAFLINDNSIMPISKGNMPLMHFMRNINFNSLNTKGRITTPDNESFIYYNLKTSIGNILVFKNSIPYRQYLKITYIILISVFIISILFSIPLTSYIGKKLSYPILQLKDLSEEIAKGNFNVDLKLKTNDEIEDLYNSLKIMAYELDKKYSMQKDFVANVSHDFKTPLSIIRNYSEAIKDGIIDEFSTKEYSQEIISEVDKLNLLVTDLLYLSKLQQGNLKIKKQYFNLKEFIQSSVNNFSMITKEKNISIILNIEIDKNTNIYGNEFYISRVVYNFMDNAIKFSSNNSEIILSIKNINEGIKISFIDNGTGIDEEFLKNIWNKYYKSSKSGGMGLGLAICSQILEHHNFKYGVHSKLNKGSEFYFIIPSKYTTIN